MSELIRTIDGCEVQLIAYFHLLLADATPTTCEERLASLQVVRYMRARAACSMEPALWNKVLWLAPAVGILGNGN